MKKTILVTGGAGYIGSHFVKELAQDEGYELLVVDNLSKGHKESLPQNISLFEIGLDEKDKLNEIFKTHQIEVVIHFAGSIEAGESMQDPAKYFRNNVANTLNLLEVMKENNCKKLIFSSTAAIYGEPEKNPITEEHPKRPTNYYGLSKLMIENFLEAFDTAYGLKYVALRYFNAAGADPGGKIGPAYQPSSQLIPKIFEVVLGKKEKATIFGTDYPTLDGTGVRDYVHVTDLAKAHILALKYLETNTESKIYNLGGGRGYSVKEVIGMVGKVTGRVIPVTESSRRIGDTAEIVASPEKIKEELGWSLQFDLKGIIETAWSWYKNNPEGYKSG